MHPAILQASTSGAILIIGVGNSENKTVAMNSYNAGSQDTSRSELAQLDWQK